MRRGALWSAVLLAALGSPASAHAAGLVAVPTSSRFWAGTRLTLSAERAPAGRLRVRVEGTVSVARPTRVHLYVDGCGAGTDEVSSYRWTPESHPADRQAVPAFAAYQQSGSGLDAAVRGKLRVSYSATVGYGWLDGPGSGWTDCVSLGLARRAKAGADSASAFDRSASTLYVTVGLEDGRHIACGPAPAFCSPRRPAEVVPPALPDFPPAPGYPGSPGYGEPAGGSGKSYPYHVCPSGDGRFVLCTADQAASG